MMNVRASKRKSSSPMDATGLEPAAPKEEEKTIPFLKRLTDMLQENDEVISFYPGNRTHGVLGKIVVHDRARVEAEVLPQYFNHASFASLRRQLNYFSFTRMGKGRQRGATYINEGVVDLEDILFLKRRSTGGSSSSAAAAAAAASVVSDEQQQQLHQGGSVMAATQISLSSHVKNEDSSCVPTTSPVLESVVPVVHLPPKKKKFRKHHSHQLSDMGAVTKKQHPQQQQQQHTKITIKAPSTAELSRRPPIISPGSTSPIHASSSQHTEGEGSGLYLDLTKATTTTTAHEATEASYVSTTTNGSNKNAKSSKRSASSDGSKSSSSNLEMFVHRDADVLAGCNALLSIAGRAFG